MSQDQALNLAADIRQHLNIGLLSIVLLIGGSITWAANVELSSAVIGAGTVVVENSVKTVKHLTGGVVGELLVREGQLVEKGAVLMALDSTLNKSALAIVSKALNQSWARQARLEAERDGVRDLGVPQELSTRLPADELDQVMSSERRLLTENYLSRDGQKKQLTERINQLKEKIAGHALQQKTKAEEIQLIDTELQAVNTLYAKGMMTIDRVNSLARSIASLRGERGQLMAAIAETKGKIAEIELELLQVDQVLVGKVMLELADIQVRQGELIEREIAAASQLNAATITAPISGRVHQLAVHTEGGVISPAESLMQIVPQGTELEIEASIAAQDIDQLAVGQQATLRLTAFNQNTTPELAGEVVRLSPDLVADANTGVGYYRAGISVTPSELDKLNGLKLVPGMPVEALIKTGSRSVLSYLLKPIGDHAQRAFREE